MASSMKQAVEKARTKKGEGPFVVSFVDDKGDKSTRSGPKTKAISILGKAEKKEIPFIVTELPQAMRDQLAAMAIAKRISSYVANNVNDKGDNVLEFARKAWEDMKAGKLYARGAGKGVGRPFPFDKWNAIMVRAGELKKQKPTDKQLSDFRAKLESATGKDRQALINKLLADKNIARAKAEWEAKNTEADEAADGFALAFGS